MAGPLLRGCAALMHQRSAHRQEGPQYSQRAKGFRKHWLVVAVFHNIGLYKFQRLSELFVFL